MTVMSFYTKYVNNNILWLQVPAAEEEDIDEMDDIDKVRDDLQSTKQLLAIELRYDYNMPLFFYYNNLHNNIIILRYINFVQK